MRNMSYRNHYSGSPWQQGGPPFGVGNYGQNYGGYNDNYPMMNTGGYGRNQGGGGGGGYGGGGMYGSGGMGQMRSMGGYGGPSPSRHYGSDRMGGGSRTMMSRGQMQRKRLPQRSPAGGPRSKRPNLGIGSDRRSSKPRRRRESRGGSKGRGRGTDDEDAYNPAEPTDDASDIEYVDGFESWPESGGEDTNEGTEQQKAKENGDQNLEEVADVDNKDDVKAVQKKLICYVCKVTCSSESKYKNHQSSDTHKTKIDELVSVRREKRQGSQEDDKGSDKEKDSKKKVRKPGNWCTVCECVFNGNFLAHRRTKEHRKKRDKKYPKCRPCRMGFSSSEEYRDHYKSEDHKLKSAEFHYLKGLASGSDDDEEAIRPAEVEPSEDESKDDEVVKGEDESVTEDEAKKADEEGGDKVEVKTEDTAEGDEEVDNKKEGDADKKDAEAKEKKKPREPKALGQSFVISVQGYYCKLCRKFFKNVSMAKSKHCRSVMHQGAYKQAMEDALVQEEDRQKLAEEQDKLDRDAAEAAELAADIAAVEKTAKEAVKREAAKKKAELQKGQDVEMKDEVVVKEEVVDKTDEKMEVADQKLENGTKEQAAAESEESSTKDSSSTSVKDDKSQEEKSGGDTQEEDGEDEGDEEPEKAKEEVTTSPATRRGRGRGRGRKRR